MSKGNTTSAKFPKVLWPNLQQKIAADVLNKAFKADGALDEALDKQGRVPLHVQRKMPESLRRISPVNNYTSDLTGGTCTNALSAPIESLNEIIRDWKEDKEEESEPKLRYKDYGKSVTINLDSLIYEEMMNFPDNMGKGDDLYTKDTDAYIPLDIRSDLKKCYAGTNVELPEHMQDKNPVHLTPGKWVELDCGSPSTEPVDLVMKLRGEELARADKICSKIKLGDRPTCGWIK